jgi:MFS family permease
MHESFNAYAKCRYHVSNSLFVVFNIACAVSTNVGMLIAFRFLAGCVGSTPIVLGGGSIADTTPPESRAGIMSIWVRTATFNNVKTFLTHHQAMGPLLGPVVGPICGGFLAGRAGCE